MRKSKFQRLKIRFAFVSQLWYLSCGPGFVFALCRHSFIRCLLSTYHVPDPDLSTARTKLSLFKMAINITRSSTVHKDNIIMCFKLENLMEHDKFVTTFTVSVHFLNCAHDKAKTVSCLMKDGPGRWLFSKASFVAMNQAQDLNYISWTNQP